MNEIIGIGYQDFARIRQKSIFYVDKTRFIREWWEGRDEVTLIARPRRFGKTLNMSMLEKFFSVQYAGFGELFCDLAVWEDEAYRRLQGTYPVMFISFADVKETSYVQARKKICRIIKALYNRFDFLLEGELLNESEKDDFRNISVDMEDNEASYSIKVLSGYLSRYYGKNVIILLDEYDTPMQEAYVHGYWDELVSFIRSMFNATFKTNPYLERAIMTGVTRVSKESIFSDLNNLKVITTTSDKYADSFGFTENEVFAALDKYGWSARKQEVKSWYDGFTFGNRTDIYNPWSIINYLSTGRLESYWANTSSNSLAGKLIREGSKETKQIMEKLLSGETLVTEIDEQIAYNQLIGKRNAVWSLLLASGYLRVADMEFSERTGHRQYELELTNREVKVMFKSIIRDWFSEVEDAYNDFIKALLFDDIDAMNDYMNKVAMAVFSYFDTGNVPSKEEPERFYHGFVLGLMVELSGRYVLTSNRESGFGRYDVMLEPLNSEKDDGIIMEFKVFQPRKERSLEDTLKAALKQIQDRQYERTLNAKGIPKERIRTYGFAFRGKQVLIGKDNCSIPVGML